MTAVSVFVGGHPELLLHDLGEVVGIGVAAELGDAQEGAIGSPEEVQGLQQAPFADHLGKRLACQELYGVAEVGGVDVEAAGNVLGQEVGAGAKHFYHCIEDALAGGLVAVSGEQL